jgi:hypothetical protein
MSSIEASIQTKLYKKPAILIQAESNPILLEQIVEDVGPRLQDIILAYSSRALERYNLRPGRLFGNVKRDERFKIVQLSGNVVVYRDLLKDKMEYKNVDELLEIWNLNGYVEISPIDQILTKIKKWLTPFLGGALVGALITWLLKKLG